MLLHNQGYLGGCSIRGRQVSPCTHQCFKLSHRARQISGPAPVFSSASNGGSPLKRPEAEFQPSTLALSFESDVEAASVKKKSARRAQAGTGALRRAPLTGGVKTATIKLDLPSPPVAVRNLVEHAQFGHLCTVMSAMHHRRAGYPFGTLIDFAADGAGNPIFCLSPLALHSRNLLEEPRASLVVQMPGWTGLANARVTIFGEIYQLEPELQASARDIFVAKHSGESKERWVSGNFVYFRMSKIIDIYFVGGFGTVQWIDPGEYHASPPDTIVAHNVSQTLQILNRTFAEEVKYLVEHDPKHPVDELLFISIDASGADVRVRMGSEFNIERVQFGQKVSDTQGAINAMREILEKAKANA